MAGHQQRPLEFTGEPFFEPDDRFDVEMVGRFVEQQHIGVEGEDSGQGDAHLPAAAERFDRPVVGLGADAESGEDGLSTAFQVVAAAVLELLLGVAVTLEQAGHFIVGHRFAHGRFHFADLLAESHDRRGGGHDLGEGRASRHFADILRKMTDHGLLRATDLPGIGLFLAGDQAKDGGLAGAVRADQAAAAAGQDLKAGIAEQHLGAVLLGDVGQMNHAETPKEKSRSVTTAV